MKFPPKYKWFKISYLELFFLKILFQFRAYKLFIFVHMFPWMTLLDFFFFFFWFWKSRRQQKLAKKFTHFTTQFCPKNLIHFLNLNSLEIENNMLLQHSQKSFSLYKFSSQHFSVWCQKKHLYYMISWRTLKANACRFLYISVRKIFVPEA